MRRVCVVGTTGSGKTTLARQLAGRLGCPMLDLDEAYWGPNWVPQPAAAVRAQVTAFVSADTWTLSGNYRSLRDLTWGRADTLIWLDYPLPFVLWRLLSRTVGRVLTQETLFHGNRETVRNALLSRESLFVFALRGHHRHRREWPDLLRQEPFRHLTVLRFHRAAETERWRSCLPPDLQARIHAPDLDPGIDDQA